MSIQQVYKTLTKFTFVNVAEQNVVIKFEL